MRTFKELRQFTPEELLFNEEETRVILKFIFESTHHEKIDSLPVSDYLRGFAQGLLLEAIDATYAIGFVVAIIKGANPIQGTIKLLKRFGKEASIGWFKHASVHDMQNIKIYDFVRKEIGRRFTRALQDFQASIEPDKPGAFLAYEVPAPSCMRVWG